MELQRPRLFGSLGLSWNRGPVRVGLQTIYQGKQAVAEVEEVRGIAGLDPLYGSAGFFHNVLISDLNARYQWNDGLSLFGGINNLWDEEPFSTQTAWPVGPRAELCSLACPTHCRLRPFEKARVQRLFLPWICTLKSSAVLAAQYDMIL